MANEWRHTTWGEEISLEYGKALRGYADSEGPVRVFGTNGPVGWTTEPLTRGPGIILGRKGAYRGVRYSPDPFYVIDTAYYVSPKTDLHMRWLYYAIIHHGLGEIDDGSPIPSTTRAAVYVRDLAVPPLPEQEAIAHILGTLDDKIELNRRMNETLDATARAIFKSWFIDYDPVHAKAEGRQPSGMDAETAELFPDGFEDSEIHPIPRGWRVATLADVTTKIGSGATPRGGKSTYVDDGVALIRSQNVYDSRFVWAGLARITDAAAEKLKSVVVHRDDVLLNITGASILRTCVVEPDVLPARVNQHVAIVRPGPGMPARYIHFHLLHPNTKSYLLGMDAGASRQAVTKGHIESVPVVVPTPAVLQKFSRTVTPLFDTANSCRSQSRCLAATRDTLLPQLLSGEIRIADAEKFLEARV